MTYLVETPHDAAQCLAALDAYKDKSPELLSKVEFGCENGVHDAWGFVDASSEDEVKQMIPESMRDKARVIPVKQYTREDIESLHKM